MRSKLILCSLLLSETVYLSLSQHLGRSTDPSVGGDRFSLTAFTHAQELLTFLQQRNPPVDCLILQESPELPDLMQALCDRSLLLPAVVLQTSAVDPDHASSGESTPNPAYAYHNAIRVLPLAQLDQIEPSIDEAISKFLDSYASGQLVNPEKTPGSLAALTTHSSLMLDQQRLADKLRERLGYLGVYYKRNSAHFFRHMSLSERQELLEQLKAEYRQIILSYFTSDSTLNEKIDNLVNLAFFADISVAQIMEIHMELMDEFSKQLKLEGRSDDILMDYRLTLIDTIAHLCEMYRRSIPRES